MDAHLASGSMVPPSLHLVLSPAPGADPDLRTLAAELSSITAQELGLDARQIVLRVVLAESSQWFVGGRSLAADGRACYQLRVLLESGSVGRPQALMRLLHEALRERLGSLHPSSGCTVEWVAMSLRESDLQADAPNDRAAA
jgi:4-oxalocrotonate tautomerase